MRQPPENRWIESCSCCHRFCSPLSPFNLHAWSSMQASPASPGTINARTVLSVRPESCVAPASRRCDFRGFGCILMISSLVWTAAPTMLSAPAVQTILLLLGQRRRASVDGDNHIPGGNLGGHGSVNHRLFAVEDPFEYEAVVVKRGRDGHVITVHRGSADG
jgi:hypothetical protein